jgi:Peptide methionine sulfoxide reductase
VHAVNSHRIQPPFPEGMQTAVFGAGCFWGVEKVFWETPGIYSTAAGYTPNPTYEEVCSARTGHTEVVLVVFDPALISYGQVLKVFWEDHDPTQGMRQGNDVGGLRRDHHRDRPARPVLLRRGLPPAVPLQGAERLLPRALDRCLLPGRPTRRVSP